jgi:hypothetical protein
MSTAPFGVGRPRKPQALVETVPRIGVRDLARSLSTASRASATVRVVVNGKPEVLDVVCNPRFFGGEQALFLCPACSRKCRHLYLRDDPRDGRRLACRQCAGLTYKSQHVYRRGINRVRRLREKIGALPSPLAPIPQRPRYVRRDYWVRRLAELARAEAALAAQLHAIIPRMRRRLKHDRHHGNRAT